MDRNWYLYQMTSMPIQIAQSFPNCFLVIFNEVKTQSSGDNILSEGNMSESVLYS
jgi:hypothetical protein